MKYWAKVKITIPKDEFWEYCQQNKGRFVDTMDVVATNGDHEDVVFLYITVDEDDENVFMLSLEDSDTIIDSEVFSTQEEAILYYDKMIKKLEEIGEDNEKICGWRHSWEP